tara:strand:+ start:1831 stop:2235 length:405 start_codon:yes stop_codon:yes gene_type:complete
MSKYTVGLNNVGSFQVSGAPYATGSVCPESGLTIQFPYVTKWIQVAYSASSPVHPDLKIGFSTLGVDGTPNNFYYVLKPDNVTPIYELKLSSLRLKGGENEGISLIAGLTNIPTERVDNIAPSGSSWSGSVGVG